LTSVKDIEYIMNWDLNEMSDKSIYPELQDLTEDEIKVVQTFMENDKELRIDDLSWKSQIPLNRLASSLLSLEFKGLLQTLPGKKYKFTG
jgi:DNA processing protein